MARRELTVVSRVHDTRTGTVRDWDDLTDDEKSDAANRMIIAQATALYPGHDITVRYKNHTVETYRNVVLLQSQGVN